MKAQPQLETVTPFFPEFCRDLCSGNNIVHEALRYSVGALRLPLASVDAAGRFGPFNLFSAAAICALFSSILQLLQQPFRKGFLLVGSRCGLDLCSDFCKLCLSLFKHFFRNPYYFTPLISHAQLASAFNLSSSSADLLAVSICS